MAQRIVNGEQYEAMLIGGDLDGSPLDIEGEIEVASLQGTSAFAIAPSNDANLVTTTIALYVGFTGDVNIVCSGDTEPVVFFNVPGGSFLPVKAKRVMASGTTASGIVGLV
jgi:hypothetical protein